MHPTYKYKLRHCVECLNTTANDFSRRQFRYAQKVHRGGPIYKLLHFDERNRSFAIGTPMQRTLLSCPCWLETSSTGYSRTLKRRPSSCELPNFGKYYFLSFSFLSFHSHSSFHFHFHFQDPELKDSKWSSNRAKQTALTSLGYCLFLSTLPWFGWINKKRGNLCHPCTTTVGTNGTEDLNAPILHIKDSRSVCKFCNINDFSLPSASCVFLGKKDKKSGQWV